MPDPLDDAAKRLEEIARHAREETARKALEDAANKLRGK
jgi:hypothetical protein